MSKKLIFSLVIVAAFFTLLPLKSSLASEVRTGDTVYIAKDQIIDGNFYAVGNNLTIDGEVKGDVICAGQLVTINAKVGGDILCLADTLNINSAVNGNVRVVGKNIIFNGSATRNLNVAASNLIIGKEAIIGWDAVVAAATSEIRGTINGNLQGAFGKLLLAGEVAKNVELKMGPNSNSDKNQMGLTVSDEAKIDGDLIYSANHEGSINKNRVNGKIVRNPYQNDTRAWFAAYAVGRLIAIFSALILGLILISLWRDKIVKLTDKLKKAYWPAIGWGALLVIFIPIACLLLFITILGIPLALILGGLWIITMFVSKILVAILGGRLLFAKLREKESEKLLLEMTVGIVILWLIFSIPIFGPIVETLAIFAGSGILWKTLRENHKA